MTFGGQVCGAHLSQVNSANSPPAPSTPPPPHPHLPSSPSDQFTEKVVTEDNPIKVCGFKLRQVAN